MDSLTALEFNSQQQLDLLQHLDIGLVVINTQLEIKLWNSFMINHTSIEAIDALNKPLFETYSDLDQEYLANKFKSVITLQSSLTITWQQRPYLFKMSSYRPITSYAEHMYQNIRIMPLMNANAIVDHIAIVIYDVTDAARALIALKDNNNELTQMSRIDPLTNLYNRGYWESRLEEEFHRYSRAKTPSVLIMLDIDYFKKVNDTYGHLGGDMVLRALGKILTQQYRNTDIIGRYGGEEFGILLLDTTTEQALVLVKNLTQELIDTKIIHDGQEINITLSFGLTKISSHFTKHDQWIDMADKALYLSKQNGRDQATVLNNDS